MLGEALLKLLQGARPGQRPSPQLSIGSIKGIMPAQVRSIPSAPSTVPYELPSGMPPAQFNAGYPTQPGLMRVTPNVFTNNGVPYYQNPGGVLSGVPYQHSFTPSQYPALPLYSDIKPQLPLGRI